MTPSTYDTRQGWQSAHGPEDDLAWEQELGQSSVDQDTWLVSFVDIMMLLLTLFVLLLAHKDEPVRESQPVKTVAAAPAVKPTPIIETTLNATPPLPLEAKPEYRIEPSVSSMIVPPESRQSAAPRKPMARIASMPDMFGLPDMLEVPPAPEVERAVPAADKPSAPAQNPSRDLSQDMSKHAVDKLLAEIQDSALRDRVEVTVLPDSVSLEISDNILFAPASAALTASGTQLLDELAGTLQTHPYALSVEGHTDNVPIHTARFTSNWELSSTRATEVTRRLIERGIAPERVRAVGYADTHPRADNTSVEGRARNRRVSLVLMEAAE